MNSDNVKKEINHLSNLFNSKLYKDVEIHSLNLIKVYTKEFFFQNIYSASLAAQGKINDAIKAYEITIKNFPDELISKYNLSVIFKNQNEIIKLEKMSKEIIKVNSNFFKAYFNYAFALKSQGKDDLALNVLKQCVKNNPLQKEAHNELGAFLLLKSENNLALESFDKALDLDKNFTSALLNKAVIFYNLGDYKKAINYYKKIEILEPNNTDNLNNLGVVYSNQKDFEKSVTYFEKALALNKNNPILLRNLARDLMSLEKYDFETGFNRHNKAFDLLKKAIEINPQFAEAYGSLAVFFSNEQRYDEALEAVNKSIDLKSELDVNYCNAGVIYKNLGDFKSAKFFFHLSLQINPYYTESHRYLSNIIDYTQESDHLNEMNTLLSSNKLTKSMKVDLSFALGKAYEDKKDYKNSSIFIDKGNNLFRSLNNYDIKVKEELAFSIKENFDKELFKNNTLSGNSSIRPIFILGMPRSGTSLVEQILSSHSKVFGGGEIQNLEEVIKKVFMKNNLSDIFKILNSLKPNDNIFSKIGDKYLDEISLINNNKIFFTNKMPFNFRLIGMIKLCLPGAKIIHCKRDPIDNCLSNYKNFFISDAMKFSNNLKDLGKFYNLYFDLMKFWNGILPNYIYDINYEDLVNNQKNSIYRLLNFCNLDWEDTCLEFYKTKRAVDTASSVQVRKPTYSSSIDSWKNYKILLKPLLKELDLKNVSK
ncbi:MAG: tetratricopeptide repeat-containing sulfotransferase family protein [Alphaproteobacteria bacterium]